MRLLLPMLLLGCTPGTPVAPHERPESSDPRVEAFVRGVEAKLGEDLPGVALALVVDGRLEVAHNLGHTSDALDEPVGPNTLFGWASVTKVHTASAAVAMADEGLLALSDRVVDWVPELREAWIRARFGGPNLPPGAPEQELESMTIEHLISHRSGLPDYIAWKCRWEDEEWLLDFNPPLHAPPGTFYNYTNTGFSVLGVILQRAAGAGLDEVMERYAFGPMGMRTATLSPVATDDLSRGHGYLNSGYRSFALDDWTCSSTKPAAGMAASAQDLGRSLEQFLGVRPNGFHNDRLVELMGRYDSQWRGDGSHLAGYGQFLVDYDGQEVIVHDGFLVGFSSRFMLAPEAGFGIAVATNRMDAPIDPMIQEAMAIFAGTEGGDGRNKQLSTDHSAFEGEYLQPLGAWAPEHVRGVIRVVVEEGVLTASFPNGEVAAMEQVDGGVFRYSVAEGLNVVRFLDDEEGRTWMAGRYYAALRGGVL